MEPASDVIAVTLVGVSRLLEMGRTSCSTWKDDPPAKAASELLLAGGRW